MGAEKRAVIATTVLSRDREPYERVRSELTLRSIDEARKHNFYMLVVDGGSPASYIDAMREKGAMIIPQEQPGMGNARRQVLREASLIADIDGVVIWMEPEKYTLVPLLRPAVEMVTQDKNDLVLFQRKSLASYPEEQALAYEIGALAFEKATGFKADYAFGPMALSHTGVEYMTAYNGEYGDLWDSIHIPRIRMMQDGRPWANVEVDYTHPPEQTAAEGGVGKLVIKRMEQVGNVLQSLGAELQKLRNIH
jgi:glycosyltransferase involved in cell wall biosynthesis